LQRGRGSRRRRGQTGESTGRIFSTCVASRPSAIFAA